jgi:hypothetical protein
VVATKADLLTSAGLAQSLLVIEEELQRYLPRNKARYSRDSIATNE